MITIENAEAIIPGFEKEFLKKYTTRERRNI